MSAPVRVRGVTKVFNAGRPDEITALAPIELEIPAGQFTALIGPSGCGKSTLLRLVADLTAPTTGGITVDGLPAPQARREQRYGIAFQQAGLFGWRTVQRNVELPMQLRGLPRAQRHARAEEMLRLVGLADFAGHYPAQLSGGMQQRVAIARALAVHPPLLLLDEPFGALDEMTRERLQDELLRLCGRGANGSAGSGAAGAETTVIFVTHSITEAVYLSDRVLVMSARPGRISADIPVDLGPRDEATRQSERFFGHVTAVRRALRGPAVRDAA